MWHACKRPCWFLLQKPGLRGGSWLLWGWCKASQEVFIRQVVGWGGSVLFFFSWFPKVQFLLLGLHVSVHQMFFIKSMVHLDHSSLILTRDFFIFSSKILEVGIYLVIREQQRKPLFSPTKCSHLYDRLHQVLVRRGINYVCVYNSTLLWSIHLLCPVSFLFFAFSHQDPYLKNYRIEWDVQDIIKEHNSASCKIK